MDHQLRAIRLVTERYRELQGLRLVLGGVSLAGCFGAFALMGAPGGAIGQAIVSAVMIGISFPGIWLTDRYYATRFGRVVRREGRDWTPWVSLIGIAFGSSALNTWSLALGPVAFVAVIIPAAALWVSVRDWPLRGYHVFAALAACGALWFVFATPAAERWLAEALAMVVVGAVYIPIGFLDHRLLTTVMPKRDALEDDATRSSAPDTEQSTDRV